MINVLQATNPEQAPNYEELPEKYPTKGELPTKQNKTIKPIYTIYN